MKTIYINNVLKKKKKEDKIKNTEDNIKKKTPLRFWFFTLSKYLKKYYTIIIFIIFLIIIFIYYIFQKDKKINNNNIIMNNNIEIIEREKNKDNIFIRIDKLIRNIKAQNIIYSFHETEDIDEEDLDDIEKEDLKNMTNILTKANKYILLCENGTLKREISQSYSNPKITASIASYNSEKTIKAAIRSIQNQNMVDIEILVIDDASTDNSLAIIEELQKEDKRIRIIKNKENSGPLFSRSLGALLAKGKYLMLLDSDDLFINENIFNICYNEAEKNNIDILEFSGIKSESRILKITNTPKIPKYLKYKENNLTITQPKLSSFIYKKKNNKIDMLIDGYLWGKCIRSEIYRKSLDTLGENIYKQKIFYGEDRIVNFVLFKVANSFKFIKVYGIAYYKTSNSITNLRNKIRNCHDELINIMSIFNFTRNSSNVIYAEYELNYRWNKIIKPGLNAENAKYAKDLIEQMLQCNYIGSKSKEEIGKYLQYLNKIEKDNMFKRMLLAFKKLQNISIFRRL